VFSEDLWGSHHLRGYVKNLDGRERRDTDLHLQVRVSPLSRGVKKENKEKNKLWKTREKQWKNKSAGS